MALVDYSDSEGSDTEQPPAQQKVPAKPSNTNFSVDRSNPQKIRVKLSEATPTNGTHEDEPAPKRARLGGGFSGFNAMLPAPKRTAEQAQQSKAPARKVFSLKTGAEPGFSREADAELKELFATQDQEESGVAHEEVAIPDVPKKTVEQTTTKGNAFMFKPLSVARNPNKRKKPISAVAKESTPAAAATISSTDEAVQKPSSSATAPPPKKKMSLFSAHTDTDLEPAVDDQHQPSTYDEPADLDSSDLTAPYPTTIQPDQTITQPQAQSLSSIATDLNLSAAERRQLFGRSNPSNAAASNIINFNTDQEYAANQALLANGDTAPQHNPVRSIAPGKHSLRQLVSSAQGQKDALEESFAAGRRNKREAGSKYGW